MDQQCRRTDDVTENDSFEFAIMNTACDSVDETKNSSALDDISSWVSDDFTLSNLLFGYLGKNLICILHSQTYSRS